MRFQAGALSCRPSLWSWRALLALFLFVYRRARRGGRERRLVGVRSRQFTMHHGGRMRFLNLFEEWTT